MNTMRIGWMAVALLPLAASAQGATSEDPVTLRPDKAVIYDASGDPLLVGDEDYLFTLANNPEHRIFAIDPDRQRIRISPDGHDEYWLACTDVRGGAGICPHATGSTPAGETGNTRGGDEPQPAFGRLPDCPGDPRCP